MFSITHLILGSIPILTPELAFRHGCYGHAIDGHGMVVVDGQG